MTLELSKWKAYTPCFSNGLKRRILVSQTRRDWANPKIPKAHRPRTRRFVLSMSQSDTRTEW